MSEKKLDLEIRKEIAKIGMTAALGVAVFSAPFLKRNKTLKNVHTAAGLALTGLALWHHTLYQPPQRSPRKTEHPRRQKSAGESSLGEGDTLADE